MSLLVFRFVCRLTSIELQYYLKFTSYQLVIVSKVRISTVHYIQAIVLWERVQKFRQAFLYRTLVTTMPLSSLRIFFLENLEPPFSHSGDL